MLPHQINRGLHALTDRHRRHQNDEFGKPVTLGQLERGTQIHVGFARTGFHLHIKLQTISKCLSTLQTVTVLDPLQVRQDRVLIQHQIVTHCADLGSDIQTHLTRHFALVKQGRLGR